MGRLGRRRAYGGGAVVAVTRAGVAPSDVYVIASIVSVGFPGIDVYIILRLVMPEVSDSVTSTELPNRQPARPQR